MEFYQFQYIQNIESEAIKGNKVCYCPPLNWRMQQNAGETEYTDVHEVNSGTNPGIGVLEI